MKPWDTQRKPNPAGHGQVQRSRGLRCEQLFPLRAWSRARHR
jgi:hypothetical protein